VFFIPGQGQFFSASVSLTGSSLALRNPVSLDKGGFAEGGANARSNIDSAGK
jgi:hypothetical protein